MKTQILAFLACSTVAALLLALVPLDHQRIAWRRLDQRLQETGALGALQKGCGRWTGRTANRVEALFTTAYPLTEREGLSDCTANIALAEGSRFHLIRLTQFDVRVVAASGKTIYQQNVLVHHPTLLALWPLVVFGISLFFGLGGRWLFPLALAAFAIVLEGGSLIGTFSLIGEAARYVWIADAPLPGLLLLVLWTFLYRFRERAPAAAVATSAAAPASETATPRRATWSGLQRLGAFLFGLWNPVAFTVAVRLVFPFQHVASRLKVLLDVQVLFFALSLYLLSTTADRWHDLATGALLPRYFTFAVLLFTVLNWEWTGARSRARSLPSLARMPFLRRSFAAVVICEIAALQVRELADCPTLTRIGLALVASLLVTPRAIRWREALRHAIPALLWLFGVSLLGAMVQLQGIPETLTSLSNPSYHPIAAAFFTFFSGIVLGICTGNFAAAYFWIAPLLVGRLDLPLVRASLLDGVLLGYLFSPISMLNTTTMVLFHFPPAELFKARWRQLHTPLIVGLMIYLVSAFNSVAILRPVTFVFLCLVAVAWKLRQENWKIGDRIVSLTSEEPVG